MAADSDARCALLEARVFQLERTIDRLVRRAGAPFALARSTLAPDDTGVVQLAQLQLDALSVRSNVPVLYSFGLTGCPPIDTDMHVAFLDGDRSRAVAIAGNHQSYRLKNLGLGDSALYDIRGAYVWLTATGPVIAGAGNPVVVQGDLHVSGRVFANYGTPGQVGLDSHTHKQGNDSLGAVEVPTDAPTPGT